MVENNIEPAVTPNKLAIRSALAYSVYFLVLIYIFKLLGVDQNSPNITPTEKIFSSIASYVPFILAIVYVQTNFKQDLGGYISFRNAFSAGFKVAAYAGLLLAIILVIYYKFLDRTAFDTLMDSAIQAADNDANRIKGVEMMKPYMAFFIGFGAAITYTILGLIVSLVGAAFIKKENI